jgi:hypothetical protein
MDCARRDLLYHLQQMSPVDYQWAQSTAIADNSGLNSGKPRRKRLRLMRTVCALRRPSASVN